MAKFFIRTVKQGGTATLYTDVKRQAYGIRWRVNTGVKVDVASWNKAQSSAKALARYYATEEGKAVQQKTELVEGIIKDYFQDTSEPEKKELEKLISDVINIEAARAKEELHQQQQNALKAKAEEEKKRLSVVWNYYASFVERIASGEIRQGRKRKAYTKNSVALWRDFGLHLKNYLAKRRCKDITFDEINKSFADGFTNYLEGCGLMLATVNKYINCMRRLCNVAAEDEANSNAVSLKVWHSHEEKDEDKRAEIALSESEIDALYNMELTGWGEKVRDMWLLGYFSGQRVSDYTRLTRDNFKRTKGGVSVIVLTQQKTGKEMVIPILDERALQICEKYDFNFPTLNREQLNRVIKEVAKELSESVPSLKEWQRTRMTTREHAKEQSYKNMCARVKAGEKLGCEEAKRYRRFKAYADEHESGELLFKRDYSGAVVRQRWELITCHTSRRSAVTAMYDSGLYDLRDIMAVSGHQTMKNLEKYIRRDAVQQAESVAEKARRAKEVKINKKA